MQEVSLHLGFTTRINPGFTTINDVVWKTECEEINC